MTYEATIKIPKEDLDYYETVLSGGGNQEEDWYEDMVESFTAKFENGYEADVKVVGADEDCPWAEAVLFTPEGYEVGCSDVEDSISGDWELYDDYDNKYIIHVVGV